MKLAQKLCVWRAGATAELDPMFLLSSCGWMHHCTIGEVDALIEYAVSDLNGAVASAQQLTSSKMSANIQQYAAA